MFRLTNTALRGVVVEVTYRSKRLRRLLGARDA